MKIMVVCMLMLLMPALSGCGKSAEQLRAMTDDELGAELFRAKFGTVGFGGYDQEVRAELLRRHPEWPQDIKDAIVAKEIKVGMNKKQVAASWGAPTNVQETLHAGGKAVVWKYGTPGPGDPFLPTVSSSTRLAFVFFDEREIVVAIQD